MICLLSRKHIADSTHYNTLGAGWMREDHALHWGAAIGGACACAGLGEGAHICSLLGELVWSIAGNYGVHYASSPASYPMSFSTAAFEPRVEYLPLLWNRPLVELPTMCFFLPSWRMASSPDLIGQHYCYFCFDLESFPKSVNPPTHPRVFVRFGNTKGEIRVKKGDFPVIWIFLGVWTLSLLENHIWITFGKTFPKKAFFGTFPNTKAWFTRSGWRIFFWKLRNNKFSVRLLNAEARVMTQKSWAECRLTVNSWGALWQI